MYWWAKTGPISGVAASSVGRGLPPFQGWVTPCDQDARGDVIAFLEEGGEHDGTRPGMTDPDRPLDAERVEHAAGEPCLCVGVRPALGGFAVAVTRTIDRDDPVAPGERRDERGLEVEQAGARAVEQQEGRCG